MNRIISPHNTKLFSNFLRNPGLLMVFLS